MRILLLQQRETAIHDHSLDSSSLVCGTAQAVSDSWWSCSCSSHWARLCTTLSARDIVVSRAAAPRRHCVGAAKTERRPGSHRPHHLWLTSTTPSNVDPNERTSASTRSVFRVSTVRSTVESWFMVAERVSALVLSSLSLCSEHRGNFLSVNILCIHRIPYIIALIIALQ